MADLDAVSKRSFALRCGTSQVAALGVHPSVFIAVRASSLIPRGSVLIHNGELKRRTKGEYGWQLYPDIYSALRGMVHALRSGGAQPDVTDGELQELALSPKILRRCVPLLFSSATESDFVANAAKEGAEYLIESYQQRRNPNLMLARARMLRGMQLEDVLGRKNPGAAAMSLGGAIHQLHAREVGLRIIMQRMNMRVIRIAKAIHEAVDTYADLLALFGGARREYTEKALFIRLNNRQYYSRKVARDALKAIDVMIARLGSIYALPFIHNASHTIRDLTAMRESVLELQHEYNEAAGNQIETWNLVIRQAILWFRVLHAHQTEIYAPLSWVMEDVERRARIARKAMGDHRVSFLDILNDEDRARFKVLLERLYSFRKRIASCSDAQLTRRIRSPVLMCYDRGISAGEDGYWLDAKRILSEVSGLL